MKVKRFMNKRLIQVFSVCALLACAGCSGEKVPPPPKTQPELLLEIYDSVRNQQYDAALRKIQKLRGLDPTSVTLPELENVVRFNRLTAVVNAYMQMGNFDEALAALQEYETRFGFTEATSKAKEQLFYIASLDHLIAEAKNARHSDRLAEILAELDKKTKNTALSPKIRNFLQTCRSKQKELRLREDFLTRRELLLETQDRFTRGDRRGAGVLALIYSLNTPDSPDSEALFSAWETMSGKHKK